MRYTLALLIPLAACATMPVERGPGALEQTQRVGPLRVTPVNVVEDSRCGQNARCVWGGRVVVRVEINGDGERLERNLTLGEPVDVGSRRLMLDGVTPERDRGSELSVAAYRFHFALADR